MGTDINFLIYLSAGYIIFSALLGLIPAKIASGKGRNFFTWWVYGFFLFVISLVHSMLIKKVSDSSEENGDYKKCPYCAETIKKEAIVCRYCGRELPYKRCPYCAEIINEDAQICNYCGKKLPQNAPKHNFSTSPKTKPVSHSNNFISQQNQPVFKENNAIPSEREYSAKPIASFTKADVNVFTKEQNISSSSETEHTKEETVDIPVKKENKVLSNLADKIVEPLVEDVNQLSYEQKHDDIATNISTDMSISSDNINNADLTTSVSVNTFNNPNKITKQQQNILMLDNINSIINREFATEVFYGTFNWTAKENIIANNKQKDQSITLAVATSENKPQDDKPQSDVSSNTSVNEFEESDLIACKILKACSAQLLKINFVKVVDGIIEANKTEMIAKILVKADNQEKLSLYCLNLNGTIQKVDCEYDIAKVEFSLLPDETKFNVDAVNDYMTVAFA